MTVVLNDGYWRCSGYRFVALQCLNLYNYEYILKFSLEGFRWNPQCWQRQDLLVLIFVYFKCTVSLKYLLGNNKLEHTFFLLQENILIRDSLAAADWCRKATFDGGLKLPAVLSMDREEKKKALQEMDTWNGELDEGSPAELFTFLFKKKKGLRQVLCRTCW